MSQTCPNTLRNDENTRRTALCSVRGLATHLWSTRTICWRQMLRIRAHNAQQGVALMGPRRFEQSKSLDKHGHNSSVRVANARARVPLGAVCQWRRRPPNPNAWHATTSNRRALICTTPQRFDDVNTRSHKQPSPTAPIRGSWCPPAATPLPI